MRTEGFYAGVYTREGLPWRGVGNAGRSGHGLVGCARVESGEQGAVPCPFKLPLPLTRCCALSFMSVSSLPQDSDNPDLRDRGYIYWRLLSTDPVAAKEVVLAEKPLISEETDLIEPTLLDELICYIGTLASVYHKPPNAFVEGGRGVVHKSLPPRTAS